MSSQLLLPNRFKIIGWCLFIPAFILWIVTLCSHNVSFTVKVFALYDDEIFGKSNWLGFVRTDIIPTLLGVLFIAGGLMIGFSKEKREDEFIVKLRLSSLLWAVWVNYALLFLAFVFIYGTAFLTILYYNTITVLIIFIIRFNYMLYRYSKTAIDEK